MRPKITKQKVLIVANVTWNIYNFRLNLLESLIEAGLEIHLAAVEDNHAYFLKNYPEVNFVPLKRLQRTSKNPFRDLLFLQELNKVYKTIQPDWAIHYTIKPNIYGGMIARWRKIPHFSVVTGLGYSFIHNGWLESLTEILYKIGLKRSSKVIFENNDDKELFIEKGIIKPAEGSSVQGCGVNTNHFQLNSQKKEGKGVFVFSYMGRLLYDKGLSESMAAFLSLRKRYPNIEFWIIGKRDLENPACISEKDFSAWIEQEGVFYKGYREDVRPFIEKSDCVVYPSYREGMPRLVLEAMSMETPVITTDVAGCRETIIDGEHGFLVPAKDCNALEEKMEVMLHLDHIDRLHMGQKARQRAIEVFKDTKIARDLMALFRDGLKKEDLSPLPTRRKTPV